MEMILASQSPRRRELLAQMGVGVFRVVSPDVDERVEGSPAPGDLVAALSARKGAAVARGAGLEDIVIAADTVVAVGGAILGKPRSAERAAEMLRALSGRVHEVYTGVTVLCGARTETCVEVTRVHFRPLTEREIFDYIATGEPMDKAGAYGIQGYGALLVERIEGDYFNVMGLPVCRLGGMLAGLGVDCLRRAAADGAPGKAGSEVE